MEAEHEDNKEDRFSSFVAEAQELISTLRSIHEPQNRDNDILYQRLSTVV